MKRKGKILAGLLSIAMVMQSAFPVAALAEEVPPASDVIADFSFDSLTDGLKGGNAVAEVSGGSIDLVENGDGYAAKFTAADKDYLRVTAADGSSLLSGYEEMTVSFDIIPGVSGTQWVFFAAPDDTMLSWNVNGNKERYLGVLVKNGTMEIERYKNNGSRPEKPTVAMNGTEWQHIDIVYAKDCTVAYLNGERVSRVDTSYALQDILGADSIFQIGKGNWNSGEYSTMQLDNFKIVAGTKLYEDDKISQATAELEEKLGDIGNVTEDLELLTESSDGLAIEWSTDNAGVITADGKVTVPEDENTTVTLTAVITGGSGQVTKSYKVTVLAKKNAVNKLAGQLNLPYSTEEGKEVYGNITLPDTVDGTGAVIWETDHPEIINVNEIESSDGYDSTPAGVVTRPEKDTDVTLTATVTLDGNSAEKTFTVTVKAAPEELTEEDFTDYFFAYFTGEGYADGEQIYFSASHDGLNWKELNGNNPVLTSTLGEKGVRDPFILRSPEGDKFYLIATDLKINGGNGWTAAQEAGSQALMVWESTDLVNWSEQRMVTVSAGIEAGCTWAPEATYDERTGEYVVYWASKVAGDGYAKQRLYYAKTRDFYSFTEPQVYIEKDQSSIDTTMIEHNGTYYRYTKNEGDATNELGAQTKTIFIEKSSDVLGTFTPIASDTLNSRSNQYVEGPTIFKFNKDDADTDTWCLLVDDFDFGGVGYYPLITTDLESGVFTKLENGYQLPGGTRFPRHGTPIRITAKEFAAVAKAYEMDTITTEELIDAIDSMEVTSANTAAWKELLETYKALPEEEKALVTEERYEKLKESVALGEMLRKNGVVVQDQSTSGYDFAIGGQTNAVFVDSGTEGRYMKGWGSLDTEGAREMFNHLIGGTQPFTVEMVINPNGYGVGGDDYNMLFSKGDDCAALRVSEHKLYFHIKDAGGWKNTTVELTDEQMSSWIHVAAIYDGSTITAYADGETADTAVGAVLNSSYSFGIGYCEQKGRYGKAGIRSIHVYNTPLTKEQLDAGNTAASDENVVLWYDFADYSYGVEATAVRSVTEPLNLMLHETAQAKAEMVPYYADGEIVWTSLDKTVAEVTASGEVTGTGDGSTAVRASVKDNPSVYTDIPVTVTNPDKAGEEEISQLRAAISEMEGKVTAEDYTEESYQEYQIALEAAKDVLEKRDATSEEVRTAAENLQLAFAGLVKEPETEEPEPPETEEPEPPETEKPEPPETEKPEPPETEKPETPGTEKPETPGTGELKPEPETSAPEVKPSVSAVQAKSKNYCTVEISWEKADGAEKYVVYRRKAAKGAVFQMLATVGEGTTKYKDKKAAIGVKYEYAVQALGQKVDNRLSGGVTCKAVPAEPKLKAKALRGGVKLTWKKVKVPKKKNARSYRVFRKTAKGKWKKIATLTGGKKTYVDRTAKKGVTYYYRVAALAKSGKKTITGAVSQKGVKVKAK